MKYFVLKPESKSTMDQFAFASRAALRAFSKAIRESDPQLAEELLAWAKREAFKALHVKEEKLETENYIKTLHAKIFDLENELASATNLLKRPLPNENLKSREEVLRENNYSIVERAIDSLLKKSNIASIEIVGDGLQPELEAILRGVLKRLNNKKGE